MDGSRRRTLAAFGARVIGFGALCAAVLLYCLYVLTPKQEYGVCGMLNYYRQDRDTVDVLVIGTSLAYADVNTNILWEEYGIAAYDLATAQQPYWVSYYYLEEALKTQSPQLIILDAKASTYKDDYATLPRSIQATYGILSLDTRIRATLACVEADTDRADVLLGFPLLHERYSDVTADDFSIPPDNKGRGSLWKGYIEQTEMEKHSRPSVTWTNVRRNINAREERYVRMIFELAESRQIPVLVVGFPNADYANDHLYYNNLFSIAEEYGAACINYNDPSLRYGLRYTTDCADWQHLNVGGSVKLTRQLGKDLTERFDLPDRRGQEAYASYDRCAEQWFETWPEYRTEAEDGQAAADIS